MQETPNLKTATLHIKNMVSSRCIRTVRDELAKYNATEVERTTLGKAVIEYDPKKTDLFILEHALGNHGFEVLKSREDQLVEEVKIAVIELVYYGVNANSIIRNSDYISEKVGLPYSQLSKVFSDKTGSTLEKYIILIKIEKVKELISYDELTLSEIAYQMGYSSVQYLSNQFKQITGYTPSEYKNQGINDRRPLDSLLG